jgi:hypothetical protein
VDAARYHEGVTRRHRTDGNPAPLAPPPAKADVVDVARRVHDRALAWLRRHRYLDERSAEVLCNEPAAETLIDALARLALAGGTFVGQPLPAAERAGDEDLDRKAPRLSATCNGFDVHGDVRVEALDDERRERLVRYCARPPFALERIAGTAGPGAREHHAAP